MSLVIGLLLGVGIGIGVVGALARARLVAIAQERDVERERLHRAEAAQALALRDLEHERSLGVERLRVLTEAHESLTDQFKALSADALRDSSRSLLALAEERFAAVQARATGELDERRSAVEHLVAPIGESLSKMEDRLQSMELTRQDAYSALVTQVRTLHEGHEKLRTETGNLVTALRSPTARGRWGEIQLRRVVEMAGMLRHCDFTEQAELMGDDGRLRPDIVVHLPGDKTVVVDAKAPLDSYLDAVGAVDDGAARLKLIGHARQLRVHVDKLAAKSYWESLGNTPDFVVLFLPSDQLLSAALEHDAGLMEHAVASRVLLATPVTLIALLRSVAYGWQQQSLADNARRIADLGREMQDRLSRFAEHLAKVGRGLETAVDAYNASVGSFESRVLVTGRRFQELEVAGRPVPEVPTIDRRARAVSVDQQELLEGEARIGLRMGPVGAVDGPTAAAG